MLQGLLKEDYNLGECQILPINYVGVSLIDPWTTNNDKYKMEELKGGTISTPMDNNTVIWTTTQ